jgi:citrate synthase
MERQGRRSTSVDNNTITITDNRTNATYTLPVTDGSIRAMDLRQIKTGPEDFGLMSYDPAFMNTASCRSSITFIDGDKGILRYRGYPIEVLAEKCSFLEVACLTLFGDLPDAAQLKEFSAGVMKHTGLHENIKNLMRGFTHDAHPMSMFISTVAALSSYYPDARDVKDEASRRLQILRLIGKVTTIAAWSYRHRLGLPYVYPDTSLSYPGNFMNMLWRRGEGRYQPHPALERALDILFILHIDHEQNCSTNTMRSAGSSLADPFVSLAAAAAALSGPLHGGANEEVLRMLDAIGTKAAIPEYIKRVKAGEVKLMGFGHRIYKNYDPRAKIIKQAADAVFEVTGKNPKLEIAIELERIALEDEYFVKRRLYPNVDFYSGIIYQAMGFPPEMFTVLFAIGRTVGWLAQWQEMLEDPEQKIARPRQLYVGHDIREFIPMEQRTVHAVAA